MWRCLFLWEKQSFRSRYCWPWFSLNISIWLVWIATIPFTWSINSGWVYRLRRSVCSSSWSLYVIWGSILGAAPFSLLMPHVGFVWTIVLSFCVGLVLSSAFPAILLYAQELLPYKLGLISGLFFGFAFGVAGIASAVLGNMADHYGIEAVYNVCGFMPLLGLVTWFLPNLKKK